MSQDLQPRRECKQSLLYIIWREKFNNLIELIRSSGASYLQNVRKGNKCKEVREDKKGDRLSFYQVHIDRWIIRIQFIEELAAISHWQLSPIDLVFDRESFLYCRLYDLEFMQDLFSRFCKTAGIKCLMSGYGHALNLHFDVGADIGGSRRYTFG